MTWVPSFQDVVQNCQRLGHRYFGSTSTMQVKYSGFTYKIEIISEGHPATDTAYVNCTRELWSKLFISGFGSDAEVQLEAKLLSGSRQNGTPSDQWIAIPQVESSAHIWGDHN